MKFACSVARLHLPGARSLKDKRSVVRHLVDRIHRRYRVSVAETGELDLCQRAEIAVAAVHRDGAELERLLAGIERTLQSNPDALLLEWSPEFFEASP